MLRSLYAGVAGLTSHQTRMDVIGNNIANVNTYGFKSSRVTFRDIYYQTSKSASGGTADAGGINPSQIGYGVTVASVDKNMSRSSFVSSASALDVAIGGEGFIQVMDQSGNRYYTRTGTLNVDNAGNLIDSTGKFVLGTTNQDPLNADGLSPDASSDRVMIDIPDVNIARVTNPIGAAAVAGTLGIAEVTVGFLAGNQERNITVTLTGSATAADAVTAYNPTATPATLAITINNPQDITNVDDLADRINSIIENEINNPANAAAPIMTEENFTAGDISIALDMGGVTNDPSGALSAAQIAAVRAAAVDYLVADTGAGTAQTLATEAVEQQFSDLTSYSIGENGVITGVHPVHGMLTFGRIDLATFNNPNGLDQSGSSYFTETTASGAPNVTQPGLGGSGGLVGSALEMSNVNLAQEFSDMITTQRGFQANSRIITTSDEMLEELVNLKR